VPRAAESSAQNPSGIYRIKPIPLPPRAAALCRAGTVNA